MVSEWQEVGQEFPGDLEDAMMFSPVSSLDGCSSKELIRKIRKPLMEKKRRARINTCLEELKDMLLLNQSLWAPTTKRANKPTKLEKADVLELTVRAVRILQERYSLLLKSREPSADAASLSLRFEEGYRECMSEVGAVPGLNPKVRDRLLNHLNAHVSAFRPTIASALQPLNLQTQPSSSKRGHARREPFNLKTNIETGKNRDENEQQQNSPVWRPW